MKYRKLVDGDIRREGDQVRLRAMATEWPWVPTIWIGKRITPGLTDDLEFRRPIKRKPNNKGKKPCSRRR